MWMKQFKERKRRELKENKANDGTGSLKRKPSLFFFCLSFKMSVCWMEAKRKGKAAGVIQSRPTTHDPVFRDPPPQVSNAGAANDDKPPPKAQMGSRPRWLNGTSIHPTPGPPPCGDYST